MAETGTHEEPSSEELALSQRVQALEDREAIRHLAQDYRRHLDARDLAAYASLFAEDGEWHGGTGYARGPDAIRTMLEERLSPNPKAPGPTTFHLVTEPVIELDGDRASGTSTWALLRRGPDDTPELAALGHYDDLYVRVEGYWRFARRLAIQDMPHHPLAER